jgi:hypothetical protein
MAKRIATAGGFECSAMLLAISRHGNAVAHDRLKGGAAHPSGGKRCPLRTRRRIPAVESGQTWKSSGEGLPDRTKGALQARAKRPQKGVSAPRIALGAMTEWAFERDSG